MFDVKGIHPALAPEGSASVSPARTRLLRRVRHCRLIVLVAAVLSVGAIGAGPAAAQTLHFNYPSGQPLPVYYPHAKLGWCYHATAYGTTSGSAIMALRLNWCSNGRHITSYTPNGGIPYARGNYPYSFEGFALSNPLDTWISDQYSGAVDYIHDEGAFCVNTSAGAQVGPVGAGINYAGCSSSWEQEMNVYMSGTLFKPAKGPIPVAAYYDVTGWHWVAGSSYQG